jgi:hypothetical protein
MTARRLLDDKHMFGGAKGIEPLPTACSSQAFPAGDYRL